MLPLLCAFPNNPFHRTSPHCQSLPRHIHNCVSQNCSRFKRLKSVTPVSYTLPSISLTQLPSLYLLFILTRSTNLKTLSDFSQLALSVSCPSLSGTLLLKKKKKVQPTIPGQFHPFLLDETISNILSPAQISLLNSRLMH